MGLYWWKFDVSNDSLYHPGMTLSFQCSDTQALFAGKRATLHRACLSTCFAPPSNERSMQLTRQAG